MNKKGDIGSIIYVVFIIFAIGVAVIFGNMLSSRFNNKMLSVLNSSSETQNSSDAITSLQKIETANNSVWDYAFLAIFFGYFLSLAITSYMTRVGTIFYWIYGILSMVGLVLSVILANTWQQLVETPEMAETITRFPITNFILGTYYPTIITVIIMVVMILLFGKTPDSREGIIG